MELQAVIESLKALKRAPLDIEIVIDSQYVMHGFTQGWVKAWKAKRWIKKQKPVPNADLWQELDRLVNQHRISWTHIRGHQGNELNERCDGLAYAAAVAYRDSQEEPIHVPKLHASLT
jgi:ribonuclease HI